jgi:pentatricopeptide repeat protein
LLEEARNVLEKLPERHVFSWSALIGGYAQQGQGHEALNCFEQMQNDGLSPDMITFICLLKACASIGAGDKGKQIHDEVVSRGFLAKNTVVGTAVVDMYAKCGLPRKAQQVLEGLVVRNRVSWSALIAGYAQQGQAREALNCFERMLREGIEPDEVIFLCVLSACSHSGLLKESQMLFGDMTERYGITPTVEHHTCMVSVFGLAGHFEKALSIIMSTISSDNPEVWLALLGACRKWGNVKLGILAFDQIVQLDYNCAAAYVFMAKIFAAAGMQEDADKLDAMKMNYNP